MAVGIRSGASTGSYGSTLQNLNPDAGARGITAGGRMIATVRTIGKNMPDFIGGEQGTIYFNWKAVDEANGYDYAANGKVLGSSKKGYETKAEKERRIEDRRKAWEKFANNVKGIGNRIQSRNQGRAMYETAYRQAIKDGKTPAQARVAARRHVNEKEQNAIIKAARKSGLVVSARTQR